MFPRGVPSRGTSGIQDVNNVSPPQRAGSDPEVDMSDDDETKAYRVVVNHEEQHSIWPVDLEIPNGWTSVGPVAGTKQECLDYVEEHWTDMRPLSLREAMADRDD
jgi:MbtH protein